MQTALAIYLILINLTAFISYGLDKRRAKRGAWRIPERTLILLAAVGGSIGAYAGMRVFHHKTRHNKFKYGVPAIFIAQAAIAALCYVRMRDLSRVKHFLLAICRR